MHVFNSQNMHDGLRKTMMYTNPNTS